MHNTLSQNHIEKFNFEVLQIFKQKPKITPFRKFRNQEI